MTRACGLAIIGLLLAAPLVQAEEPVVYLTLEEAVYAALADSLEIQISEVQYDMKATDLMRERAIYDTMLTGDVSYEQDESDLASTIGGTEVTATHYDAGVTKTLRTGTQLELSFKNSRTESNSTFATTNPAIESLLGVAITQPLLRNFGGLVDRAAIHLVQLEIEQQGLATQNAIEHTVADVERAYWALASARSQMEQRGAALTKAEELLAATEEQAALGLVEPADLLAVKIHVEQRQDDVLVARHDYFAAMDEVKRLLNRPGPMVLIPSEPVQLVSMAPVRDEVLQRTFSRRRDLQELRTELRLQDVAIRMHKNARWPQLDLVGSLTANGIDTQYARAIEETVRGQHPDYFLGLKLLWPWGGGGKEQSAQRQAELKKTEALLKLHQLERDILFEVDDRLRTLELRRAQAQQRHIIANLQRRKLEQEQQQFHVARSSIQRVMEFDDDVLLSTLALTQGIIAHRQAITDLARTEHSLLDAYR